MTRSYLTFRVDLPDGWTIIESIRGRDKAGAAASLESAAALSLPEAKPDLLANLLRMETDSDGKLADVTVAGLSVRTFAAAALPSGYLSSMKSSSQTSLSLDRTRTVELLEQTYVVKSADETATAILTFATPNLDKIDALNLEFRAIATSLAFGSPNPALRTNLSQVRTPATDPS